VIRRHIFAKRAKNEGLTVIDSPDAILRCSNKVFLNELMDTHNIPRPVTHLFAAQPARTVPATRKPSASSTHRAKSAR